MRRQSGLVRTVWRIAALMQLVLPGFVSIADARLERDAMSARAYSHVESTTTKDCVRAHRADCPLCQHLTTPGTKAAKPALFIRVARLDLPGSAATVARAAAQPSRPALPRAPPVA